MNVGQFWFLLSVFFIAAGAFGTAYDISMNISPRKFWAFLVIFGALLMIAGLIVGYIIFSKECL